MFLNLKNLKYSRKDTQNDGFCVYYNPNIKVNKEIFTKRSLILKL